MEEDKLNKSNKIKVIVLTVLLFLIAISGITYAYFSIQIVGNEEASSIRVTTANLKLIYTDTLVMSGDKIYPGWSETKTITVENAGNQDVYYSIIWRELLNEITNNELVISASCTSSVQGNTCPNMTEKAIPTETTLSNSIPIKRNIGIEVGETHTYQVTILFKETGSVQNYNQDKEFYGTLNIEEFDPNAPTDVSFFTYSIENNEVTITGYDTEGGLDVIIPSTINELPVITIGNNSLANKGLMSVVIPNTVTEIGGGGCDFFGMNCDGAFYNNQLISVTIPNSVTAIGRYAFAMNQLTSVIIQGKSSSSDFTRYGSNIWGWASGYDDSDIIWTGSGS